MLANALLSRAGDTRRRFLRPEPDDNGLSCCQSCDARFPSWGQLYRHVRKAHVERSRHCPHCEMSFKTISALRQHVQTHLTSTRRRFLCAHCSAVLLSKNSLTNHLRTKHFLLQQRVQCPHCTKSFTSASYAQSHARLLHINLQSIAAPESTLPGSHRNRRPTKLCCHCAKPLDSATALLTHLRKHTGQKPFGCSRCAYSCSIKSSLMVHLKHIHMRPRRSIECPFCAHACDTNAQLERHLAIPHSLRCGVCGVAFTRRRKLMLHMVKHAGEKWLKPEPKKFKCSYCLKGFRCGFQVEAHLSKHTGRPRHWCELCNKAFAMEKSLVYHRKTVHSHIHGVSSGATFKCAHCLYVCDSAWKLRKHMSIHSKLRPFKCDQCSATFPVKSYLAHHRKYTHDRSQLLQCSLCTATFDYAGHLTRHMKVIHDGKRPVRCAVCGMGCHNRNHLMAHFYTHTGVGVFQCNECTATYASTAALRDHKARVHANKRYDCRVCQRTFITKKKLTYHMNFHAPEKPFHCSQCPAKFYVKRGLTDHRAIFHRPDGGERYRCALCLSILANKPTLRKHFLSHAPKSV